MISITYSKEQYYHLLNISSHQTFTNTDLSTLSFMGYKLYKVEGKYLLYLGCKGCGGKELDKNSFSCTACGNYLIDYTQSSNTNLTSTLNVFIEEVKIIENK